MTEKRGQARTIKVYDRVVTYADPSSVPNFDNYKSRTDVADDEVPIDMFASTFNVHYIQNVRAPFGLGNGLDIRGKGNIIDVEISKDGSVIAMCFGANSESFNVTDKEVLEL